MRFTSSKGCHTTVAQPRGSRDSLGNGRSTPPQPTHSASYHKHMNPCGTKQHFRNPHRPNARRGRYLRVLLTVLPLGEVLDTPPLTAAPHSRHHLNHLLLLPYAPRPFARLGVMACRRGGESRGRRLTRGSRRRELPQERFLSLTLAVSGSSYPSRR